MSSRIARAIMSVAVAVGIALLGAGAIGSAVAQPSAARFAALECLTNRDQAPISETDARHAGRRERREAAPAVGVLAITSCRTSSSALKSRCPFHSPSL